MPLRGGTVRDYLQNVREAATIPGATEHTLRAPLIEFLVEAVRFDAPTSSVWINASQRFTGVPSEAWAWGLGFRPLEHYLDDRKGRALDLDQIQGFHGAIVAVRTSIELAPALDAALDDVLTNTLDLPSA